MEETLELSPRTCINGAGIYDAGNTERCYTKLFVTDAGYVLPINHRPITEEDLLDVYTQGRLDGATDARSRDDTDDRTNRDDGIELGDDDLEFVGYPS